MAEKCSVFHLHWQSEQYSQIPNSTPSKLPTLIFPPSKLQGWEHVGFPHLGFATYSDSHVAPNRSFLLSTCHSSGRSPQAYIGTGLPVGSLRALWMTPASCREQRKLEGKEVTAKHLGPLAALVSIPLSHWIPLPPRIIQIKDNHACAVLSIVFGTKKVFNEHYLIHII